MFTFPVSRAASVTLETFKQFKDFFFLFIYQLKTQIFPRGAASRAGNKQILKFLADLRAINVKEIKGVFKEPGFADCTITGPVSTLAALIIVKS